MKWKTRYWRNLELYYVSLSASVYLLNLWRICMLNCRLWLCYRLCKAGNSKINVHVIWTVSKQKRTLAQVLTWNIFVSELLYIFCYYFYFVLSFCNFYTRVAYCQRRFTFKEIRITCFSSSIFEAINEQYRSHFTWQVCLLPLLSKVLGLGTHLFLSRYTRPGDSEGTFSVLESSCHLLLPV